MGYRMDESNTDENMGIQEILDDYRRQVDCVKSKHKKLTIYLRSNKSDILQLLEYIDQLETAVKYSEDMRGEPINTAEASGQLKESWVC